MKRIFSLVALLLVPAVLVSQAPKKRGLRAAIARANAAADSSDFHFLFSAGQVVTQTGDSLGGVYKAAVLVSPTFDIEGAVQTKAESSYTEANVALNLYAAIFPGATVLHGQGVFAGACYQRQEHGFQWCAQVGAQMRAVATNGFIATTGPFYRHLFARAGLPSENVAGIEVDLGFAR